MRRKVKNQGVSELYSGGPLRGGARLLKLWGLGWIIGDDVLVSVGVICGSILGAGGV